MGLYLSYYTLLLPVLSARTCVWPEGGLVVVFAMHLLRQAWEHICILGAGVAVWAIGHPPVHPAMSACQVAADRLECGAGCHCCRAATQHTTPACVVQGDFRGFVTCPARPAACPACLAARTALSLGEFGAERVARVWRDLSDLPLMPNQLQWCVLTPMTPEAVWWTSEATKHQGPKSACRPGARQSLCRRCCALWLQHVIVGAVARRCGHISFWAAQAFVAGRQLTFEHIVGATSSRCVGAQCRVVGYCPHHTHAFIHDWAAAGVCRAATERITGAGELQTVSQACT